VWDALNEGHDPETAALDPGLLNALQQVHELRAPAALDLSLVDQIWGNVIAGTAPLWTPAVGEVSDLARGVGAGVNDSIVLDNGHGALRTKTDVLAWAVRFAGIVAAGFLGGFVAGVGARLAMRLAGLLTSERNQFILTENGNRVGEITLGGTVFLGLLAGGAGVAIVLMYLGIRDRLPGTSWQRSAVFSILLLVVFGYVLMDPGNPDYHLFGHAWLNVITFSSIYLVMGFCTSQAYELSQRYRARLTSLCRYRGVRIPLLIVSPVISLLGLLTVVGSMFVTMNGMPVVVVGLMAWLASRVARRYSVPSPRLPTIVQPWGFMIVPGIVGLILTVRGVTEILTSG
jgi:hypothetical protein